MKTTALIFRILGLILFAIAGYYLGEFLAGIIDSNINPLAYPIGGIIILGALGFLIMPYITLYPILKVRSYLTKVSGATLLSALIGLVIGLIILAAWYTSSNIGVTADDTNYSLADYYAEWDMLAEDDAGKPATGRTLNSQSFTFINPIGQTYGYVKDGFNPALLTFGLVSVFGVILGSFLWSLFSKSFRIEWFVNFKDFLNHLFGGILMGFGGVLALGCTIGQGITGVSTLALGSILTLVAIIFGSAMTMKIQYYKLVYEDEASFSKAFITALADMKLLPSSLRRLDKI